MQFSHLAIFGPGLIGGSLVLAARQRGLHAHLSVWSPSESERQLVVKSGLADLVTGDPVLAATGANLVVLCTPPAALPLVATQIAPHLEPGTVVTDVASVKGGLVEQLDSIFRHAGGLSGSRYVGGHPMAGAEQSGWAAAQANLFENSVCLLTPLEELTAPVATATVEKFWLALGATVRCMSPEAHDAAVALVSHLPHVLAAALVEFVDGRPENAPECAGPGWRDMTRLAGGAAELWTEILSRNRAPVTNALHGMIAKLHEVLELLETGREADLERFLEKAKCLREGSTSRR